MVRQLASIKLLSMWGALRAQTFVLVLSLLAYLYGLFLVGSVCMALIFAGSTAGEWAPLILGLAPSLYTLGWIVIPIVLASQDSTLDPYRLSPYVANSRRLAFALVLTGAVGVGGVYFFLVQLATVIGWNSSAGFAGLWASILGCLLGSAVALVWCKALGAWLGRRQSQTTSTKEKGRLIAGLLVFFVGLPLLYALPAIFDVKLDLTFWLGLLEYVQWTPFGAPWFLPAAASSGAWLDFAIMFAIAVVTIAVGWWVLRKNLGPAMFGKVHPLTAQDEAAIREGRHLVDARTPAAVASDGGIHRYLPGADRWMRLGLSGPSAAVAERTRIYWLKDSRLSVQLVAGLALAVIAIAQQLASPELASMSYLFILFAGFIVGQVIGTLLQYDSTAFWLHVSVGLRGFDDRLGRMAGSGGFVIAVLALSVVIYGVAAQMSIATILYLFVAEILIASCTAAATMVIGSQWVYPVQPPGTSVFSTKGTGQFAVTMIVGILQLLAGVVLTAIPGALMIWAYWGSSAWQLGASVFALVWSALTMYLGIWLGGRILDRSQVEILTKIRSWPGHGMAA